MRHSVELQADSLYEAVVMAWRTFRDHDTPPAPAHTQSMSPFSTTVMHTVTIEMVKDVAERQLPQSQREGTQRSSQGDADLSGSRHWYRLMPDRQLRLLATSTLEMYVATVLAGPEKAGAGFRSLARASSEAQNG
jgi:hypothetical protein